MGFIPTEFEGLVLWEPRVHRDERGYFCETYREDVFEAGSIGVRFVQDNEAQSVRGVLRGLHYQTGASAQAKLVRVVSGEVLDVAVDLRPGSKTYGRHFAVQLSATNHLQMFIPRGFAHGYVVLSKSAVFQYKCDNYYDSKAEAGLCFDDPSLGIDWILPAAELIISEKDRRWPVFGAHVKF